MSKVVNVAVTGAAGQIGYSLLPRLVNGETFSPDTQVNLRLIEIPAVLERLKGVQMELEDSAFAQLGDTTITADLAEGFRDADWVLLVGSLPRGITIDGKKIEERSDLLRINGGIFTEQGRAIGEHANDGAKILVVGNPANTNALIGANHCANPSHLWLAMTALDANRARAQLAQKAGIAVRDVSNLCIWGNHSPTMYPDVFNARIGGKSAFEAIGSDQAWLDNEFLPIVQQRGKAIIDARGASSATSAANAALNTVQWVERPTPDGEWFSAAVRSDGSYEVPEGLFYGYPLRSDGNGKIEIVQGLELGDYSREKLAITTAELEEERSMVSNLL